MSKGQRAKSKGAMKPAGEGRRAKGKAPAVNHESAGTAYDPGAVGHELVGREQSPAVETPTLEQPVVEVGYVAPSPAAELVKCRFCDAKIPKPEGTVYECPEHANLTGTHPAR